MSPPCVSTIFEDDNGGATSPGVTGTEIRVGVPIIAGAGPQSPEQMTVRALFAHVNERFELYGRRLVPIFVEGPAGTATEARAKAVQLAAQGVFAALTGVDEWHQTTQASLIQALALEQVVTVVRSSATWWEDRTLFDPLHPYVWSVFPSSEDFQANLAELSCSVLAGRLADHAGDAGLRGATRSFGILSFGNYVPPSARVLSDALAECAGRDPLRIEWLSATSSAARATAMNQLRANGVTTVICLCEGFNSTSAVSAAHTAGYHPEWILMPSAQFTGHDELGFQSAVTTGRLAPPLRLTAGPRVLPFQARAWYRALQSTDPGLLTSTNLYPILGVGEYFYDQLLVLASGIQGAGPRLVPDTFAQALMTMQFPNPGAGAPPFWQPSVGFAPGDHSFYDDYAVAWWSSQAEALDYPISSQPKGSWCYLDQAARFRPGSYPTDAYQRLFNPAVPCR